MVKQGHDVADLVAAEEHFQTLPLTWTPRRHAMYKLRAFRSVVECLFSLTIVNDDGIPLVSSSAVAMPREVLWRILTHVLEMWWK